MTDFEQQVADALGVDRGFGDAMVCAACGAPDLGELASRVAAAIEEAIERVNGCHGCVSHRDRLGEDARSDALDALRGAARAVTRHPDGCHCAACLAEWGWTIIANAGGGDWTKESADWQAAAARWRDAWVASRSPGTRAPHEEPRPCVGARGGGGAPK